MQYIQALDKLDNTGIRKGKDFDLKLDRSTGDIQVLTPGSYSRPWLNAVMFGPISEREQRVTQVLVNPINK